MFSLFYVPLFASAVLGASPFQHHNFHRHLAREFEATDVSTTKSSNATVDMVTAAYFAGWHADNFTLDDVSWEKYTHMIYSFAVTGPDTPNNVTLTSDDDELLTQLVTKAQNSSVKAMLSIGGWTGGRSFSTNVNSSDSRTAFVQTVVDLATKYDLDGVDFDWEYPNDAGIGCNALSPNDTSNFLSFLQELRADPKGEHLILSAATPVLPWKDETGSPSTNVSGFASVLDFITVMNYDVWGSWSASVGPNSPLNDTCAPAADQMGSAVSAVAAWTKAGMPAHQIVLGVASYGHSFTVTTDDALDCSSGDDDGTLAAYPAFDATSFPMGDAWDGPQGTDVCGVTDNNPSGNWDYWGLVAEGWLFANGTAQPGIEYRFDECSQTAYVYNETSQVMVSFDDPPAFQAKGEFIKSMGLRGFNMWEAGGDFHDVLLDAISLGAGIEDEDDSGDTCDAETSSSAIASATPVGTPAVTTSQVAATHAVSTKATAAPAANTNHVVTKTAAASPSASPANNIDNGGGDSTPHTAIAVTTSVNPASTPASSGSGHGDDDKSSSSSAAATPTTTPVNDSGDGDDDDCDDDDDDDETTTSAAPSATPIPGDNSGDDDDDDCDDDETSSAVSSAAPTAVSSSVEATITSSAVPVSSSISASVESASASSVSSSFVSASSDVPSSVVTSVVSTDAASSSIVSSAVSSAAASEASVVSSVVSTDAASSSAASSSAASSSAASSSAAPSDVLSSSIVSSSVAPSDVVSSSIASPSAAPSDVVSSSVVSSAAPTDVVSSSADSTPSDTPSASASSAASTPTESDY